MPIQLQLVLAVLFGVAGWHFARTLENKYGRPAWGLPSWAWGIITGLSLLLGAILLAIAERGLKKQPHQAPAGLPGYPPQGFPPQGFPAQGFPAQGFPAQGYAPVPTHGYAPVQAQAPVQEQAYTPAPATVPAAAAPAAAVPAAAEPAAAAPAVAATAVPAGWQPDPSGKYQHRWWDGQKWTNSVATNGVAGVDG